MNPELISKIIETAVRIALPDGPIEEIGVAIAKAAVEICRRIASGEDIEDIAAETRRAVGPSVALEIELKAQSLHAFSAIS